LGRSQCRLARRRRPEPKDGSRCLSSTSATRPAQWFPRVRPDHAVSTHQHVGDHTTGPVVGLLDLHGDWKPWNRAPCFGDRREALRGVCEKQGPPRQRGGDAGGAYGGVRTAVVRVSRAINADKVHTETCRLSSSLDSTTARPARACPKPDDQRGTAIAPFLKSSRRTLVACLSSPAGRLLSGPVDDRLRRHRTEPRRLQSGLPTFPGCRVFVVHRAGGVPRAARRPLR